MAACYAAKMMVPAKQGLIVNVSSAGGLRYLFNVAYGTGKAAVSEPKRTVSRRLLGTPVGLKIL